MSNSATPTNRTALGPVTTLPLTPRALALEGVLCGAEAAYVAYSRPWAAP